MADRVVARGKIRVDARKALHKLRDHMLVDLHLYATEIARAAVALGARRLDVRWDASDVELSFDGRALDPNAVASVRDHVLGGEGQSIGDDEDALRALGIGVTAALGLGPAFVEVRSAGMTLRFDAGYIADETSAPPMPEPNDGAGGSGMQVLVRRKIGLTTLGRAVRRDVPREVALLLHATHDAPFATTMNGVAVPRLRLPPILTVDLDVPDAMRAVLEVHAPTRGMRASTVFLERGVRLATYAGVEAWSLDDEELPLRVLVDARRLPTNASRSELRRDAELFLRVRDRAPRALDIAVAALLGEATPDATKLGHAVEVFDPRPEVRREALGAIAASAALAVRGGRYVPPPARALLDRPLMVDAVGAPLTLAEVVAQMQAPPIVVHTAPACEDAALAPWLGGIPWRRGHAAERVLDGIETLSADALVAEAREGCARRTRALAHPATKPTVARTAASVLVEAFEVGEGPFAGLFGEVAITKPEAAFRRSGTAHFYVEARRLESIALPGTSLPVEMALEWPGRIRAKRAYDGIERDDAIERAVLYALRLAAIAIGERLGRGDDELVRLAIETWITTTKRLGDVTPSIEALGPLAAMPAFRTSAGDLVSFAHIAAYAAHTNAVCVAPRGAGRAIDGRPVIDESHAKVLAELLPSGTQIVPYARGLRVPIDAPRTWIDVEAAAMPAFVALTRPNVEGVVGVGPACIRIYHRGVLLREMPRAGAALVVLEDAAAVPRPDWSEAIHTTLAFGLDREEKALVETVVERCERGELDFATLADWLGDAKKDLAGDAALVSRIAALPQRAMRARLEQQKAAFLARERSPDVRPTGPSASVTMPAAGVARAWLPDLAAVWSWTPPPVDVRYQGRHLVDVLVDLPVVAMVDLDRDDVVEEWSRLTRSGLSLVRNAVVSASVELVKQLAGRDSFANDVGAMKLCIALLAESPMVAARVDGALRKTTWPTVQGEAMTAADGGDAPCGKNVYPAYRIDETRSPYDAPAFHVPDDEVGTSRRKILTALGLGLRDVTEPVARLQERRARTARAAPPALPGTPAHPRLRTRLAALGVTAAEGEMEIHDGPMPSVVRVDDEGLATAVDVRTAYPVRVVMRVEPADLARAADEVAASAEHHVRSLVKHAHELPDIVRRAFRVLVCSDLARDVRDLETDALAVFPDTRNVFLRLSDLVYRERVRFTLGPAPYPPDDGEGAILVLSAAERDALGRHVHLADVTDELVNELRGAERRAQPPLEQIALSEEVRARCLLAFAFEQGPIHGEIGLLAPAHTTFRGIHLHTTMRFLTSFADSGGWPSVAVVNDDTVAPSRAFDGLSSQQDANRIRVALRQISSLKMTKHLEAPSDALGVVRLPVPFFSKAERLPALGIFWLPAEWPESPMVHLEAVGRADPFHVPRAASKVLPVCGRLWVAADDVQLPAVLEDVFAHVRGRLAAMTKRKTSPEKLAPYQWELRLLGLLDDRDPTKELALDRPDPVLLRVVARRAPHLIEIEPPPSAAPEVIAPGPYEEQVIPASAPGFFEGLVRRVIELVTPAKPPPDGALTAALSAAIAAMKLSTTPVEAVVEVHRGRPIRYDAENRRILVNTRHEALRRLVKHPSRTLFLLAAAVSEVNRELEAVTDAEELAVVRDLLRSES